MTTRVLLVDDQQLVRAGFRALVDSARDLEVVGEASNGSEALAPVRARRADVVQALRAGASGLLAKDVRPHVLLDAIHTIARGEALLTPGATRALISRFLAHPDTDPAAMHKLQVLTHVGFGRSNDEIADELFLSPLTVKTHISRVLTKTGARDRAQLVVLAYETGLVRPGSNPTT
ncbi:response regulator transcription factor [Actinopolymorpha sp. B17G11]